jgi:hypothetical protein
MFQGNHHLKLKFKFRTHTKDTEMIEMTVTVRTLPPIVSNKKVNASGSIYRL